MPKIEISDLRVTFPARANTGPVEALGPLSLTTAEGELVCIVGPSGCGKSTLLRVLAGLEQPTSGTAVLHHTDPQHPAQALVFQNAGIFPWLTVEDNVAYGLRVNGAPRAAYTATARHWVSEMGLGKFARAYPAQLSGGMQQRVGLARAFAYDPAVLLMDEPFAALDAQTRLLLQQTLLLQWEQRRKTVVFVTHSIEEALTLGDRVCVMSARPGRILREFAVPFARPRDAVALRTDPRFSALFAEIWEALKGEVAISGR
jgi:NitT/TauT family transport system ATP-binding protein